MRRSFLLGCVFAACAGLYAEDLQVIALPAPQTTGGKPLMQALNARSSARAFNAEKLSSQVLSNLLWAAWGINRPEKGGRTAPSASNRQEIDIYAVLPGGTYLYNAKAHRLEMVLPEDLRGVTGRQDYVRSAALDLIYVADFARMGNGANDDKVFYSAANTGFIAQNVYLFCSSEGLATVVRGSIDRAALAKALGLRPEQRITLAQSVGYPAR